ncbi:MAG: hypothetical protein AAGB19_04690 [Cyanobacteria bacterium P01_F01_bin.3]
MDSPIHRVRVEVCLYWYENPPVNGSHELAEAVQAEIDMGNATVTSNVIQVGDVFQDVALNSYPWGAGGNTKTIGQWLEI